MNDRNGDVIPQNKGHVLVVEDEERSRRLLRDALGAHGYRVSEAGGGVEALQRVAVNPPDIVLLDVMMPGMDGMEVCRRLKADGKTAPIPVLMVTSLADRGDRHNGIRAGADDFITKPVDLVEVMLRVGNAMRMKQLHDRLQQELLRARELEALKENLSYFVIHDMRSPLSVITGGLELAEDSECGSPELKNDLMMARGAAVELKEMISALLDISRMESAQMPLRMEKADLLNVVQSAAASVGIIAAYNGVRMQINGETALCRLDEELLRRVVVNLLVNAIKFSKTGKRVCVTVGPAGNGGRVTVSDSGPGIAPEDREKLFVKFAQIALRRENRKYSTGLGLAFCRMAVEAHGGRIGVDSEVGGGSTFWFELP